MCISLIFQGILATKPFQPMEEIWLLVYIVKLTVPFRKDTEVW